MSAARRWLKISGMYIFPVLQLKAGLLILISKASLATCLLSWSNILRGRCWLRDGCWKCCVTWLLCSLTLYSKHHLDSCIQENLHLFLAGPFIDYVLFWLWWKFILGCSMLDLRELFFEDDLYTGMSKDSSEFLTEARTIGNRDEDNFPDF